MKGIGTMDRDVVSQALGEEKLAADVDEAVR